MGGETQSVRFQLVSSIWSKGYCRHNCYQYNQTLINLIVTQVLFAMNLNGYEEIGQISASYQTIQLSNCFSIHSDFVEDRRIYRV